MSHMEGFAQLGGSSVDIVPAVAWGRASAASSIVEGILEMSNALSGAESVPVHLPTARTHPFDPPSDLGRFRERDTLCRLAYPDGHLGWLVTGYTLTRAVLADPRFSARLELRRSPVRWPAYDTVFGKPTPPGFFLAMDRPEHTRYRRLLAGQFTTRRIDQLIPRIEQIVEDQLDAMEHAGPPTDLVKTFASPIPSLVICELLGVPSADRTEFLRRARITGSLRSSAEEGEATRQEVTSYFRDLVQQKRLQPSDDLMSGLAGSTELTDEELAGVGHQLFIAGFETTANMLALGTFALLHHPGQRSLLNADTSLINNTVEELLRYLAILQFTVVRTALEDVELGGHLVKAKETVTISLPAANRDPDRFGDPDALDITRNASGHLAFGHGAHQCIGQHLARIEMRIGYGALFQRFPMLRLAVRSEDVPLRYDMATYGVYRLPVTW